MSTFFFKFAFASSFIVPVLLLELSTAIVVSVLWGLSLLSVLNYGIARGQQVTPWKIIGEHVLCALTVIVITHYVGDWIASLF